MTNLSASCFDCVTVIFSPLCEMVIISSRSNLLTIPIERFTRHDSLFLLCSLQGNRIMKNVYDCSPDCWRVELPCDHRYGHPDSLHALQKVSAITNSHC